MWRELIDSLESTAQFAAGTSEAQLIELSKELGIALSADLKALLSETNGVQDQYGFCIIWSADEIVRYNQEMRTFPQYNQSNTSFADLLFFADAGNGDRFALPLLREEVQQGPVFAWDHEDGTSKEVALSLQSYMEEWLSGRMNL